MEYGFPERDSERFVQRGMKNAARMDGVLLFI